MKNKRKLLGCYQLKCFNNATDWRIPCIATFLDGIAKIFNCRDELITDDCLTPRLHQITRNWKVINFRVNDEQRKAYRAVCSNNIVFSPSYVQAAVTMPYVQGRLLASIYPWPPQAIRNWNRFVLAQRSKIWIIFLYSLAQRHWTRLV